MERRVKVIVSLSNDLAKELLKELDDEILIDKINNPDEASDYGILMIFDKDEMVDKISSETILKVKKLIKDNPEKGRFVFVGGLFESIGEFTEVRHFHPIIDIELGDFEFGDYYRNLNQ